MLKKDVYGSFFDLIEQILS